MTQEKEQVNEVTVLPEAKAIAVFSEFDKELETRLAESKSVVHDITTKKGNKEARSFVADLRKSKKPVADAHKEAKAESLDYGRKLDAEKNRIISKIDEAIEAHAKPLADLEEAEEKRIGDIKERLETLEGCANKGDEDYGIYDSVALKTHLVILNDLVVDDSFDEFEELAAQAKAEAITTLEQLIVDVSAQEEKDAELETLRAAEAVRQQAIIDEQARKDAAKAIEDAKEEVAKEAESARLQAIEDAAADKEQAIEDERKRVAQAKLVQDADDLRIKQAAEKKAAGKAHQKKFNNEALKSFEDNGIVNGKDIIELIAKGLIKNITINY